MTSESLNLQLQVSTVIIVISVHLGFGQAAVAVVQGHSAKNCDNPAALNVSLLHLDQHH